MRENGPGKTRTSGNPKSHRLGSICTSPGVASGRGDTELCGDSLSKDGFIKKIKLDINHQRVNLAHGGVMGGGETRTEEEFEGLEEDGEGRHHHATAVATAGLRADGRFPSKKSS